MQFELLTPQRAAQIEAWFDDPETRKRLGGREDLWRGLELMKTQPGREAFDGLRVVARYIWVVLDGQSTPVGLLDVEPYHTGEAGMSILVAPEKRGQGIGVRMLQALEARPEMRDVRKIIGGVEPDNRAAQVALKKAGYSIREELDKDEMYPVERELKDSVAA